MLSTRSLRVATLLSSRGFTTSTVARAAVGDEVPVSFVKDVPNPVIKPRSEYPEWLFEITDRATLTGLLKLEKANPDGFDGLPLETQKQIIQLQNRKIIKENNVDAGLK